MFSLPKIPASPPQDDQEKEAADDNAHPVAGWCGRLAVSRHGGESARTEASAPTSLSLLHDRRYGNAMTARCEFNSRRTIATVASRISFALVGLAQDGIAMVEGVKSCAILKSVFREISWLLGSDALVNNVRRFCRASPQFPDFIGGLGCEVLRGNGRKGCPATSRLKLPVGRRAAFLKMLGRGPRIW